MSEFWFIAWGRLRIIGSIYTPPQRLRVKASSRFMARYYLKIAHPGIQIESLEEREI